MPRATSPGRPWASTCRRKTAAKPMSLPTAVTTEGSVVRAIAESAGRSRWKRPTSSATKCCASAAEPPFPNARTRPPASRLSAMRPADLEEEGGARGEEALLEGDAVRDDPADVVRVHRRVHYARGGAARQRRRDDPRFARVVTRRGGGGRSAGWRARPGRRSAPGRRSPSRSPAGTCTGTGKPPGHLALAVAAAAVEDAPARAPARVAGGRDRHVEREDGPRGRLLGPEDDLGGEAGRRERPPQVPRRGTAHEGPVGEGGPLVAAELVVVPAPALGVGQRLVGRLQLGEGVGRLLRPTAGRTAARAA